MKKLTLDLDTLQVESFTTLGATQPNRGTVQAQGSNLFGCEMPSLVAFCIPVAPSPTQNQNACILSLIVPDGCAGVAPSAGGAETCYDTCGVHNQATALAPYCYTGFPDSQISCR